ncbi:CS1 type fimbrial major subunit [Deinococcus marmoris]|uniref:Uncharacterized protein n=1 Tax=Deinococcus marmoris TaxID=249408 RepID=A0A1U7NVC8_9DEIO|nr:CS1 type fimbrial major subunit [Deinococcus marmoris]OLV16866.1 hypothetical protein BOO71_0010567 [Deinococcus marmoris]
MKYLALVAAMLTSTTLAAPVILQGVSSGSNNFQVNASVGDSCAMTQPNPVTIPVMYWIQQDASVSAISVVNIVCNTGVNFRLDSDTTVTLQRAGTTSSDPAPQNTLTATVTGASLATEVAGTGNAADTGSGYNKTLTVTVAKPTQSNRSGTYAGTVNLTLSVVAIGIP